MRFGYADPPYPGLARRYYGCPEVDHVELVARLEAEFPDGWALSTSAAAARQVWALCPEDTRLAVFVRGERRVASKRPRYAWEALFVRGGRSRLRPAAEPCGDVLDFRGRQHSHPGALVGMKPAAFASWLFNLLGAGLGDELVDLFPGSGAIGRAWALFQGTEASWAADPSRGAGDASREYSEPSWRTSATRRVELAATRRADLAPTTSDATPRGERDGRAARRDASQSPAKCDDEDCLAWGACGRPENCRASRIRRGSSTEVVG